MMSHNNTKKSSTNIVEDYLIKNYTLLLLKNYL
jgi:hypothetical protein